MIADTSILIADPERQAHAARSLLCHLAANNPVMNGLLATAQDFKLLPPDARALAAVYREIAEQAAQAQAVAR